MDLSSFKACIDDSNICYLILATFLQENDVDPMVYQIFMNVAIFISSWIVLIWHPLYLEPWAILSATLWITASILSIFAVNHIGMSIAAGIWCGTSMITSFLWGVIVFEKDHPVKSLPLAILALGILILGTSIISLANRPYFAKFLSFLPPCRSCVDQDQDAQEYKKAPLLRDYDSLADTINDGYETDSTEVLTDGRVAKPWFGVLCAVLTGYEKKAEFCSSIFSILTLIST